MNGVTWRTLAVVGGLMGATILNPDGARVGAQPSGLTVRGVVEGDIVEGRVTQVDSRTRTITLDNGQEYLVPLPVAPNWEAVQLGSEVKLRYSVTAGRNVATLLELRPRDLTR